jgi:hypothetical protein
MGWTGCYRACLDAVILFFSPVKGKRLAVSYLSYSCGVCGIGFRLSQGVYDYAGNKREEALGSGNWNNGRAKTSGFCDGKQAEGVQWVDEGEVVGAIGRHTRGVGELRTLAVALSPRREAGNGDCSARRAPYRHKNGASLEAIVWCGWALVSEK